MNCKLIPAFDTSTSHNYQFTLTRRTIGIYMWQQLQMECHKKLPTSYTCTGVS